MDYDPLPDRPAGAALAGAVRHRRQPLAALLVVLAVVACARKPQAGECAVVGHLDADAGLRAVATQELRPIGPQFFGFNVEAPEFQLSLWDAAGKRVHPQIVETLARDFPGAVYRYPGGLVANVLPWQATVGPQARRPKVKAVDWADPFQIEFGVDDYLAFVRAVGGQAWYVANLRGDLEHEQPVAGLADGAGRLAAHVRQADVPVLRWELGNELDRGDILWPYGKYVERATAVLQAIRATDPQARFVGMLQDFDAQEKQGVRSTTYNRAVVTALSKAGIGEFEHHYYYDDPPFGPPVREQLNWLCEAIGTARQAARDAASGGGQPAGDPTVWITEHGRWPQEQPGRPWKDVWHRTADLGAALGVADFMIAVTQIPAVQGAMVHALHGFTGPWPMFHPVPDAPGRFVPAATLTALRVLRASLGDRVLATQVASAHRSGYVGGYDGRITVMKHSATGSHSWWAVNRDTRPLPVDLTVAALKGRTLTFRVETVSGARLDDDNYGGRTVVDARVRFIQLAFDRDGRTRFELPPLAVVAATEATAGAPNR